MEIFAIKPSDYVAQQLGAVNPDQAALRRQTMQAVRSVNDSGLLGNHEVVFLIDRQTHRPIIRVEDKETHEIVFQAPPDYVLNLAQRLNGASTKVSENGVDT